MKLRTQRTILSPSEFAWFQLGEKSLYDWQIEALESIGLQEFGGKPTAIAAANGSGKTAKVVAAAICWFLSRFPRGQVIVTSGSFRQIEKQLWPALRVHAKKFPAWTFLVTELKTPEGGFALGFSTDDAGRAEGWHPKINREEDPVFIIVDEAKTVPDAVFEAFDRCTRVFQLWVSSPGKPWGQFYEAFHSMRKYFWTRKVRSDECPHIDPAKRARDLEKYGPDHPLFRSMHLAEFTEDAERLVLSAEKLAKALESQPKPMQGETVAFCDFAAGRDENVVAVRRGNRVKILDHWVEKDTVQAARRFVRVLKENGIPASCVWGDADGLGIGIINDMAELGYYINHFHGGRAATEPEQYANLISEVWHVGAREIERGRILFEGGLDPITSKQITTRKTEWSESGKLRVESKDKMRAEGRKSPDRGDAVLGCIVCGARLTDAIGADEAEEAEIGDSDWSDGGKAEW